MTPSFLVGAGALGAVPVALIDLVCMVYVLRVWRRGAGDPFAALPLALFFAALGVLALGQTLMMSLLDKRLSYLCNYGIQSVSVLLSAPPLVAFSYAFLGHRFPREERVAVRVTLAVSSLAAAAIVMDLIGTGAGEVHYNFVAEHAQRSTRAFDPLIPLIPAVLVGSYGTALFVLLRKARALSGGPRMSALAFACVVIAAIAGVVVNRAEAQAHGLPAGTYTAYMLWVTLAALLVFVRQTDALTGFPDRVAALVLVVVLGSTAAVAEGAVARIEGSAAAGRAADAALAANGEHPRGLVFTRAARGEADGAVVAADGADEVTPANAAVIALATDAAGRRVAAGFSYLEARVAVDEVAWLAAVVMVITTLLVLVAVPRLAEVSALRPLQRLERADADSRAKSVFLAAMSHELKTPLNAILHHARVLADKEHVGARDDVARRADVIAVAGEHLLALIESLLVAARHDGAEGAQAAPSLAAALVREPASLATLIDDVLLFHRADLDRRGITATVECDAHTTVLVDRRVLRQVLANLVGNAAKYGAGRVAIRVRQEGARARIVVEDGGPGVPEEARARIFEPFFQLAPTDGAGLGLAIARQLVEAMAGTLSLGDASPPLTGAAFVVDVPAPVVDAPAPAAPGRAAPAPVATTLTGPLRDELLALARDGDVAALQAKARDLAGDDATAAFAERLARLASRFQVRAIRSLLGDES